MKGPSRTLHILAAAACGWILLPGGPAVANDFRVETRVFTDRQSQPSSTHHTLFHEGVVYDFDGIGREVTLFDKGSERLVLFDMRRRIKTEITARELLAYARSVHSRSLGSDDALLRFCANPNFDVRPLEKPQAWEFASPVLTYRVEGRHAPESIQVAGYREFCDVFARLNSMVHPGGLPPFARLAVNAHMAENNVVPRAIHLNIAPHPRFNRREFYLRSEHDFRWGLTESDLARIEEVRQFLVTYRAVSLEKYREQ